LLSAFEENLIGFECRYGPQLVVVVGLVRPDFGRKSDRFWVSVWPPIGGCRWFSTPGFWE